MPRESLEVADIFRTQGPAWRRTRAGHLSLAQLKVMSAIEACRTAALGGHVARCQDCARTEIAYNSCRNRHCPKCQGAAAKDWLAARQAELLPVAYYHVRQAPPPALSLSTDASLPEDSRAMGTTRGEPAIGRKATRRDLVFGWIRVGSGP
jgi:hypothetical protein